MFARPGTSQNPFLDPLVDVGVLADPDRHLDLVIQDGAVVHRGTPVS